MHLSVLNCQEFTLSTQWLLHNLQSTHLPCEALTYPLKSGFKILLKTNLAQNVFSHSISHDLR